MLADRSIVMKLIISAVLLSLSFAPVFALDNSTNNSSQGWSRCTLDCDNTYPDNPLLNKACKADCKKSSVRAGKKATLKAVDPNAPVLTPDN